VFPAARVRLVNDVGLEAAVISEMNAGLRIRSGCRANSQRMCEVRLSDAATPAHFHGRSRVRTIRLRPRWPSILFTDSYA
jgi:hypothetical protein